MEQFTLAKLTEQQVALFTCDAEEAVQVADEFEVTMVPTIILTDSRKKLLEKITNLVPTQAVAKIKQTMETYAASFEAERRKYFQKLEKMITQNKIMVFIKGTPQNPFCQFTKQILSLLKDVNVQFSYYDIRTDEDMAYWLKYYSKFPTFPQLFINGELIGGVDLFTQLIQSNKADQKIPAECKLKNIEERYERTVKLYDTILFMEGTPNEAKDEETKQLVQMLHAHGVRYACFDLHFDEQMKLFL